MSIEISPENQRFLDESVASGMFPSQSAAVDQAVTILRTMGSAGSSVPTDVVPMPSLPSVLEDHPDGEIRVRGHRIGLFLIVREYFAGSTDSEMREQFETLSETELSETLAFIRTNELAMRTYLAHHEKQLEELRQRWPRGPSLEELRARWLAKFGTHFVLP